MIDLKYDLINFNFEKLLSAVATIIDNVNSILYAMYSLIFLMAC